MVVVALALLAVSLIRSGWTRVIRDPVTFIAVGLTCGSLRAALQVPPASTPSSALLTVEIAAIACAFYFLWRRAKGSRV